MLNAGFSEEQNFNARRMFISSILMLGLYILKIATAKGDSDDDDEEVDPFTGLVYYMAMRTLLEQEALLWIPETFTQSGQLMDFVPAGVAALFDLGTLAYEGVGALGADSSDSDFFYQRDDSNGRYEEGDTKVKHHLERITPYWKNWWAIHNPYEAAKNYEFGRKLRTR